MFKTVLVANRGEIAVRVIRTLNRLGIQSVAVYSDADADAPHVRLADVSVRLGPAPAGESYLSIERVLDAARQSGAQAIHPGYGFLSENAAFARACADAQITFVGPPPEATEALGDKIRAKDLAEAAGVPVLPGLQRAGLTDEEIIAFAGEEEDRFPLMVKAAAGGGGRGMRIVHEAKSLPDALTAARREAKAGFGDDALLVERYVERARHIEVQLLADAHGTALHLGERECSLQRRHQKVVEESPSPVVSETLRDRLGEAAASLALEAGYVGAGTCEFLVEAERDGAGAEEFFFLEVNARLQVEHPVTEEVTGLDLVEQQLLVASGQPLALTQEDITLRGHSIEVRVCAEDASTGFLPATGEIVRYREPAGQGIRVDSGVREGTVVTANYDSLLLKLVATGADRTEALEHLARGLQDLRLLGVTTNVGFLARLVAAPEVQAGDMDTGLIERGVVDALATDAEARAAAIAVAAIETLHLHDAGHGRDPWDSLVGFRLAGPAPVPWELERTGAEEVVEIGVAGYPGTATVALDDEQLQLSADHADPGRVRVAVEGNTRTWDHATLGAERWVAAGPDSFAFRLREPVVEDAATAAEGALEAPMPGTVLDVKVAAGDEVAKGDVLVVIESMKMELTISAPSDATVAEILVKEGDGVSQGQPLVELEVAS